MHVKLGKYNQLTVVKKVDFGVYLDGGEDGEILLPTRYVPVNSEVGDVLNVFIYLDNEERLVATTLTPLVQVGQFACLEVSWINKYGAFLNWGLMKDLFVPYGEQRKKMEVGKRYVIHAHVDEDSFRIVASAKVEHYLSDEKPDYQVGDQVEALVYQHTELGYKVIVDNRFGGLIFSNEVFRPICIGMRIDAYVKQVRPDGKIDLELQQSGRQKVYDFAYTLLNFLKKQGGYTPFNDKSPAEDIYETFGVSKKTFKKAVGDLYKKHLIVLEPDGIRLMHEKASRHNVRK